MGSEPTLLSSFTGAGGLDIGLERAGFQVIGCIDSDEQARKTIAQNRPDRSILEPHDIVELAPQLTASDVGLRRRELDLIAGGPPCQPFSKAAQWSKNGRAGLDDERGNAATALVDLVETLLPRAIMLENVRGFANGRTNAVPKLQGLLDDVNGQEDTSYNLESHTVNAADYGVPQNRHRAILLAFRDDETIEWPEPTHEDPVRAWDAIGDLEKDESPPESRGRWADLLPAIPEGQNYQHFTDRGEGHWNLFGYRRKFWSFLLKLAKDRPSWTIPAKPGPATGPFHWESRPLTIRERMRLQTFPDDWELAGDFRDQARLAGNATPPLLAEIIGRVLGEQMFGLNYEASSPSLAIPQAKRVPDPEEPAPVPRRYIEKRAGDHEAHPGAGKGPAPVT